MTGQRPTNDRQADQQATDHPTDEAGGVIDVLHDQVAYIRDQLAEEREARRRADTIIAQLTQANAALAQRVPEIEAPPGARGAAVTATEGAGNGVTSQAQESEQRRSWLYRFFFGP